MGFDGFGNRTNLNGVTQGFNAMNQPTGGTFTHNANGNLWTYNGWTYTYDVQNRLTKAVNGSATAYFYYDGKNRQIAQQINGLWRFNVWDDWELIEEYAPGNVLTAKYLQGAHGPVKNLQNNIYYYQDSLGSTSHIADASGSLVESYKYNLNGKPTDANGQPISNPIARDLFAGERYIPELGLYDLRNRYYSPDTGRFLQPDPIGFKGDASNLYRYCGNDWANRTDPMGLVDNSIYEMQKPELHSGDLLDQARREMSWGAREFGLAGYQMGMTAGSSGQRSGLFSQLARWLGRLFGHKQPTGESGTINSTAYGEKDNDPPGDGIYTRGQNGNFTATLDKGTYRRPTSLAVSRRWLEGGDGKGYFKEGDLVHIEGRGWFRAEDWCGACDRKRRIDQWTGNTTSQQQRGLTRMVKFQVFHPTEKVPARLINDARPTDMPY